ncbi:zinc knuckle CX2CX4HX4C containing protein [Tanacetum coccineum]
MSIQDETWEIGVQSWVDSDRGTRLRRYYHGGSGAAGGNNLCMREIGCDDGDEERGIATVRVGFSGGVASGRGGGAPSLLFVVHRGKGRETNSVVCVHARRTREVIGRGGRALCGNFNGSTVVSVPKTILKDYELASMTLEYSQECWMDSVLQSHTFVNETDNGKTANCSHVDCEHLLQLENGGGNGLIMKEFKPPKRYEGSVSAISKRNDSDRETSNDENSMDDMGDKGMKDVEVCLDQNELETGEIDEVLEEMNAEEEKMQNEVSENLNVNSNADSLTDQNVNHKIDKDDSNKANNNDVNEGKPRTYANMVKKDEVLVNKNLIFIAPKITDDGEVKVLFDENIVNKGCAKWMFIICGHFIGQNMSYNKLRVGRTHNARVLVEIEANKELKDVIKIEYIRANDTVKGIKDVSVMYDWKPEAVNEEKAKEKRENRQNDGFIGVQNRKRCVQNQKWNWQKKVNNVKGNTHEFRQRNMETRDSSNDWSQNVRNKGSKPPSSTPTRDVNKFNILNEENCDESSELRTLKDRIVVDQFLNNKETV